MARTTVVVGVAGGVSRRQQAKAQQGADMQARWQQQEAAGEPAAPADPIAQLKELAALKDQGILTEEEFSAQKARILGA